MGSPCLVVTITKRCAHYNMCLNCWPKESAHYDGLHRGMHIVLPILVWWPLPGRRDGHRCFCFFFLGNTQLLRGRPTPPATLAREGKVHQMKRGGQRSMFEYSFLYDRSCKLPGRGFDDATSPAAVLQEKTRFASRAVPPAMLAHMPYVRTYPSWSNHFLLSIY